VKCHDIIIDNKCEIKYAHKIYLWNQQISKQ